MGDIIPYALCRLRNLRFLGLGANKLIGKVPTSIYNLSMLSVFSLLDNELHGNVPRDVGLTLPRLTCFQIWGNNFNGRIPVTLSNASRLEKIEMTINNFSGKLAVPFGHLQKLQQLRLEIVCDAPSILSGLTVIT